MFWFILKVSTGSALTDSVDWLDRLVSKAALRVSALRGTGQRSGGAHTWLDAWMAPVFGTLCVREESRESGRSYLLQSELAPPPAAQGGLSLVWPSSAFGLHVVALIGAVIFRAVRASCLGETWKRADRVERFWSRRAAPNPAAAAESVPEPQQQRSHECDAKAAQKNKGSSLEEVNCRFALLFFLSCACLHFKVFYLSTEMCICQRCRAPAAASLYLIIISS